MNKWKKRYKTLKKEYKGLKRAYKMEQGINTIWKDEFKNKIVGNTIKINSPAKISDEAIDLLQKQTEFKEDLVD